MLRSSSIFGLCEPARAGRNQSQQFNCADTLAPDLGTSPFKALAAAVAPPVRLSPNPSLLAASFASDAEEDSCLEK
jgi:hypothetical protein